MEDNTPKKDEEERKSILGWLGSGLVRGTLFVVKWLVIAGIFILVSSYPEESKQLAINAAHHLGDATLWVIDWIVETAEKARGHSNIP